MSVLQNPDSADNSDKHLIIRDYMGGMTASELAVKYGRSRQGLYVSFHRWGVRLPDGERERRVSASLARRSRKGKEYVWPDCPEHLKDDYRTLRKYMSAREARATLESPNGAI